MRRTGVWIALCLYVCAVFGQPVEDSTRRATVLWSGQVVGSERLLQVGDRQTAAYHLSANGQVQTLDASWRVDEDGLPIEVRIGGKAADQSIVDERFDLESGRASWTSASDSSSKHLTAPAFYWPLNVPPSYLALLARALMADADSTLDLLPAGRVALHEAARIPEPGSRSRRKRELVCYAIDGLDFAPMLVWFDANGEYLGQADDGLSVLAEGRESWLPLLLEAEARVESDRAKAWSTRYTSVQTLPLLISGARVFDTDTGEAKESSVLVVGDYIAAVGDELQMALPDAVERIDARGQFLLPGLWDNRASLDAADGILHLAAGVTSARVIMRAEVNLGARTQRLSAQAELAPRVLVAGLVDFPVETGSVDTTDIGADAAIEQTVVDYARRGVVQVQIGALVPRAFWPLIARLAHANGMRVSAEVSVNEDVPNLIAAGVDELAHFDDAYASGETRAAPVPPGTAARESHWPLAVRDAQQSVISLLDARHTVLMPTVNALERRFEARPGLMEPGYLAVHTRLPKPIQRSLYQGGRPLQPGEGVASKQTVPAMLASMKAMQAAGITLIPGSNGTAGFGLLRELELYAAAGIPHADILRLATLGSARANRRDHMLGAIRPGMLADIVALDGDPLARIADIRKTRWVMKAGVRFDPSALYRLVGVGPAP